MSESRKDREERISQYYHKETGLKNSNGIDVGPKGDKVLFGEDDRRDYYTLVTTEAHDELQRKLADATVILTNKDDIIEQEDGSFRLKVGSFVRQGFPPCAGERFGNQHTGGWCSGFMVGPDLIATAGHCGETEFEIQGTAYVFGFKVASADDKGTTHFTADQVYFGKELVAHELSSTGDFAIVRVDREITASGAAPLPVRQSGELGLGRNLGVIGYPSGLPVKIAFGEATVVMRDEGPWLFANLDTYGGNSGSAVFNSEGLVEGILVRGAKDYLLDNENNCFKSNQLTNAEGGEAITKANVFLDKLPGTND